MARSIRLSALAPLLLAAFVATGACLSASAGRAAEVPAAANAGPGVPDRTTAFKDLARKEAAKLGLPYALVDAVMKVESDYRPGMIGGVGEIGLMQVRPATAAMLGFRGASGELADPAVNIHYGATYLAEAWRLAQGNVCRALMKYRAGHGEETMSALSALYCQRAKAHLASLGSPLAGTITSADLVTAAAAVAPSQSLRVGGRPKTGTAFWSAFRARIAKANARIEAKWARRQVAAR